jgi:hypothetical protein
MIGESMWLAEKQPIRGKIQVEPSLQKTSGEGGKGKLFVACWSYTFGMAHTSISGCRKGDYVPQNTGSYGNDVCASTL